ncbi:MAG: KH domain-containing protein [Candidatus Diapherotrites archaeon]|nr:KH domain-containing protein [Candidatus Micrarchaeota archaeon]MBU1939174.1 KH domain-containing protein [Candidatus Micrarchaeota archaeon]
MPVEYVRIPLERTAVLIGTGGKTKRSVEIATGTKIDIDSKTGEIEIKAKGDAISAYKAMEIVKAIGRGFSPEHALVLLDENTALEIIDLEEYAGKSDKGLAVKRGRIIGTRGRARKIIEDETGAFISVYGKTVGIVGKMESVAKAKRMVEMLLEGAKHITIERELKKSGREKFKI